MKYKIGEKVKTKDGDGIIVDVVEYSKGIVYEVYFGTDENRYYNEKQLERIITFKYQVEDGVTTPYSAGTIIEQYKVFANSTTIDLTLLGEQIRIDKDLAKAIVEFLNSLRPNQRKKKKLRKKIQPKTIM